MTNRATLAPLSLFAILLVAAAVAVPAVKAESGHAKLRIDPRLGFFGLMPVNSCDLRTYDNCKIITFTVRNVGSDPILIGGYGVSDREPFKAALAPLPFSEGCSSLPLAGGYWSLAPGHSCAIAATVGAVRKGLNYAELWIWYDDQSRPIGRVPLIAIGI